MVVKDLRENENTTPEVDAAQTTPETPENITPEPTKLTVEQTDSMRDSEGKVYIGDTFKSQENQVAADIQKEKVGNIVTDLPAEATPETPTEDITPEVPTEETKTATDTSLDFNTVEEWKTKTGGGVNNLETWIESKYGTIASVEGDKVVATIGDKNYEWKLDESGNPVKTEIKDEVPVEITAQEQFAKDNSIKYTKNSDGSIVYSPASIDEYISLKLNNKSATISNDSKDSIIASKDFEKLNKYRSASSDTIYNGMMNGDIAVGGETWENMIRLNNGEATENMLEAQKKWETNVKVENINNDIKLSQNESTVNTVVDKFSKELEKIDTDFNKKVDTIYAEIDNTYKEYKESNQELGEYNEELLGYEQELEDLEKEKKEVIKNIQKKYSGIKYAEAMTIADEQIDNLNDEIYEVSKKYNRVANKVKTLSENIQIEYEYDTQRIEQKYAIANMIYGQTKDRVIYKRDIELAQAQIEEQRAYAEEQLAESYKRQDEVSAKEYEKQIALLDYQYELNKKAEDTFTTFSTNGGAYVRVGENLEFIPSGYSYRNGEIVAIEGYDNGEESTPTYTASPSVRGYYSNFRVTQSAGDISPNKEDTGYNGGTPGIDFAMPVGSDVSAVTSGKVVYADNNGDYGNQIIIQDEEGNNHMYSHLSNFNYKVGETIQEGDIIAQSGNSGYSTGPHLDYRVKTGEGTWVNPEIFINQSSILSTEELDRLQTLEAGGTDLKKTTEYQELAMKYRNAKRIARKENRVYDTLEKLLSNAGSGAGVSDKDMERREVPLNEFLATNDDDLGIDAIERMIYEAKPESALAGLEAYYKLKIYTEGIREYANTKNPDYLEAMQSKLQNQFGIATNLSDYTSYLENGNLERVLEIAGTSFTDAFMERMNEIQITPKDTPELVAEKLEGILKSAEVKTSPARNILGEDIIERIYPDLFEDVSLNNVEEDEFEKMFGESTVTEF